MLIALNTEGRSGSFRRTRRKGPTTRKPAKKNGLVRGEVVGIKKSKIRRMAFTPSKVEVRTTVNGKPYIFSRGEIVYRRKSFTYTVMVPFWKHDDFAEAMASGNPIELEGCRQVLRVAKGGRTLDGGAYIQADRLLGVLDAEHDSHGSDEPSRSLAGHERRGYYRRQHYGPGNSLTKVIWIDQVDVNGGLKAAA